MRYFLLLVLSSLGIARERMPGEWIFTFKDSKNKSWSEVRNEVKSHYNFVRSFGPGNRHALFQFNGKPSRKPFRLPKNVTVQPNYIYEKLEADPEFDKQWALKNTGQSVGTLGNGIVGGDIDAPRAWEIYSGDSRTLAVLDTGIDLNHPDLQKNIWKNPKEIALNNLDDDGNGYIDDTTGWNFIGNNAKVQDDNHHGTFVSGIIGADSDNGIGIKGVVKKVSLLSVKMLDENGFSTTAQAVSAIEYAVNVGAKVICASWGGRSYDDALFKVMEWANEKNVFFVTAAGNSANDNDLEPRPVYPASFKLPNILSVLSVDNRNERSESTSFGPYSVHLGAPGVQIYSTTLNGGYQFLNGSSFAAPYVAGAFFLLTGLEPNLSHADAKKRIIESTTLMHYNERTRSVSGGRLNLFNALKNIRPPRHQVPKVWKRVEWVRSTGHPYANLEALSWTIHHPGATHIRIHVSKFSTELDFDKVTLRDKEGRKFRLYSGELGSFTTEDALGDTLSIEFLADYVKTGYGVDLDYYEYSTD